MTNSLWLALAAGLALPVQALINGRLAGSLGGPLPAANVSFIVATATLLLVQLVLRMPAPSAAQMASPPAWAWLGGVLGAIYVAGAIASVSALGPTSAVCLIIAGQIGAALLIDHFGILGAAGHPVTSLRLFGAGLVALGAVFGLVTLTFRSLSAFMRPFVRMPRGFCHLEMSDVGVGYKSH